MQAGSSGASSLPTSRVRNRANPEGLRDKAKDCELASYPGYTAPVRANPIGVVSEGVERGHNPVGVETRFARFPRVARSSQPWAGGRNPFGIDCQREPTAH